MDLQLTGKLAVVTGSTKGIGRAIAQQLDAEGARVVVNGRSQDAVDAVVSQLSGRAVGIAGDIGTAAGADEFASKVRTLGSPDILVNNVAIFQPVDFFEIPDSEWTRFFETNVMSGVRLSRAFMPAMMKNGWGRIVFMSSESAINIPSEMIHYGMTKTALLSIARGLAQLTTGTEVTVNSVLPGPTWSEGVESFVTTMAEQMGEDPVRYKEERFFVEARPTSILKRFTTPDEIASMVTYLCSPRSIATNGASLRADGGMLRTIVP